MSNLNAAQRSEAASLSVAILKCSSGKASWAAIVRCSSFTGYSEPFKHTSNRPHVRSRCGCELQHSVVLQPNFVRSRYLAQQAHEMNRIDAGYSPIFLGKRLEFRALVKENGSISSLDMIYQLVLGPRFGRAGRL